MTAGAFGFLTFTQCADRPGDKSNLGASVQNRACTPRGIFSFIRRVGVLAYEWPERRQCLPVLVAHDKNIRRASSRVSNLAADRRPGSSSEIDIRQLLPVVVAHDKTRSLFFDRPRSARKRRCGMHKNNPKPGYACLGLFAGYYFNIRLLS
jgi:hypothetical protein